MLNCGKALYFKSVPILGNLRYTKISRLLENIQGSVPVVVYHPSVKTAIASVLLI